MNKWIILFLCILATIGILLIPNTAKEKELEVSTTDSIAYLKASYPVSAKFARTEVSSNLEQTEIREYIFKLWGKNGNKAYKIMLCESGGNVYAFNPETKAKQKGITQYSSYGLFQINSPYDTKLYHWRYNIDKAYEIYLRQGWGAWLICSQK